MPGLAHDAQRAPSLASSGGFRFLVSFFGSMLIHLAVLITLGLLVTAGAEQAGPLLRSLVAYREPDEQKELELETLFLDDRLVPAAELRLSAVSTPVTGAATSAPSEVSLAEADAMILPSAPDWADSALRGWPGDTASVGALLKPLSGASPGMAEAVVDDYQQAMDRITQEILFMLAQRKLLVIWCFDQSGSMKDDQEEIQARLERVYAELGLAGASRGDALMTVVASFGRDFVVHTTRPTTDLETIRQAIESVPVDPSGEEMMCSAVFQGIAMHREFAARQKRQMALIVVSDESGDREENDTYLEAAIGQAVAARCRVYVLGREAVFGYPYAHLRWVHPQTGREHLLPMDRGPETAFVEQLQIDGFGPRSDAHPSGFGPYAQSRLAWKTDGIFFMLPTLEADLVRGERRRYELEATRAYRPDLRSRAEIVMDRQQSPLRKLIWKIVNDLNPLRPEVAKLIEIRQSFSADPRQFMPQIQEARSKASFYLSGLERGIKALDAEEPARDGEPSPRWKANYDLIRAQTVAYAARVRLYGAALDEGLTKLRATPMLRGPDQRLVRWRIRQHREVPVGETARKMLQRAWELYLAVIENHPGTPWAARAEWELKRDFDYPGAALGEAGILLANARGESPDGGSVDKKTPAKARTRAKPRTGTAAGTGVGVAAGGGGGGGGTGTGVGGGVGAAEATTSQPPQWGPDWYQGFELVPEYRGPDAPGGSGRRKPKPPSPSEARVPVPKI